MLNQNLKKFVYAGKAYTFKNGLFLISSCFFRAWSFRDKILGNTSREYEMDGVWECGLLVG